MTTRTEEILEAVAEAIRQKRRSYIRAGVFDLCSVVFEGTNRLELTIVENGRNKQYTLELREKNDDSADSDRINGEART